MANQHLLWFFFKSKFRTKNCYKKVDLKFSEFNRENVLQARACWKMQKNQNKVKNGTIVPKTRNKIGHGRNGHQITTENENIVGKAKTNLFTGCTTIIVHRKNRFRRQRNSTTARSFIKGNPVEMCLQNMVLKHVSKTCG